MAFISKCDKKFSVIYRVKCDNGTKWQKSEGFNTLKEAEVRKKEIEYKKSVGWFIIPKFTQLIENDFYNKKNINTDMKEQMGESKDNENKVTIPEGVDVNLLMKVLGNPEMVALITSLAKIMKE